MNEKQRGFYRSSKEYIIIFYSKSGKRYKNKHSKKMYPEYSKGIIRQREINLILRILGGEINILNSILSRFPHSTG